MGVTYFELINLSAPEIALSLEGKLKYKKHIENRRNNFLVYHSWPQEGIILEGRKVEVFLDGHTFLKQEVVSVKEFSGDIAYKRTVTGTAKVLKVNADMSKVDAGDIMITTMTTADLAPAMKRASAFVTDEGGITCHAAIIARELKKPCIIGTKIATQVLGDGDMVEVDADKGIIRIL